MYNINIFIIIYNKNNSGFFKNLNLILKKVII